MWDALECNLDSAIPNQLPLAWKPSCCSSTWSKRYRPSSESRYKGYQTWWFIPCLKKSELMTGLGGLEKSWQKANTHVQKQWATVSNSEPLNSSLMEAWMLASVAKSMLKVALSNIRIELQRNNAQAVAMSCCCLLERLELPAEI